MKLTIEDGRDSFYTFDTNRILLLTATDEEQINQVEFSTEENGETVSWTSDVLTGEDGIKFVQVPNEFLNGNYSRLVCYYVALDSKGEYTRQKEIFRIRVRQQPEDYFLTYSERVTFASIKALTEQYKTNASESADLARRYAEESEDVNVEAGTYSSKHWSIKAEAAKETAVQKATEAGTSEANSKTYMESAQSAKQNAETAKNDANTILEQVQSKGTEITNFVATSKTEIETQKNESVNAVKSVYQTDLNELKGDLVYYSEKNKKAVFSTFVKDYLINADGVKENANGWMYSSPIILKKYNTIIAKCIGYETYVSVISVCDVDGGNIIPKVIPSTNDWKEYTYTAENDCYIIVCTNNGYPVYITIDDHFEDNVSNEIETLSTGFDDVTVKIHGKNLFDETKSSKGYLDLNNGITLIRELDWFTTDYLDVSVFSHVFASKDGENGRIPITMYFVGVYDSDKNFITGIYEQSSPFELPRRTKYIRFAYHKNSTVNMQVECNNVYTNYEPYKLITTISTLKGKKWCCVGDSLTEVNLRAIKHYYDYVSEKTGIEIVNMGASGTGYVKTVGANSFYDRIVNVPTDCDVVTIFGSGNDLSSGVPLGSPTDSVSANTICGYINGTIDRLINIIPRVSLGIVTPTPWIDYPPMITNNNMEQYANALVSICKLRSIPCLDLYHESNLRPWTEEGRSACYSRDEGNGVHPDENGHRLIAPRFKIFIESLIM